MGFFQDKAAREAAKKSFMGQVKGIAGSSAAKVSNAAVSGIGKLAFSPYLSIPLLSMGMTPFVYDQTKDRLGQALGRSAVRGVGEMVTDAGITSLAAMTGSGLMMGAGIVGMMGLYSADMTLGSLGATVVDEARRRKRGIETKVTQNQMTQRATQQSLALLGQSQPGHSMLGKEAIMMHN